MTISRSKHVEVEIINATPCDLNHGCLTGDAACHAEPFVDRDVTLLWCRDERSCNYKKKYKERFICNCPVNLASFKLD